jgi:hypothetical protein
MAASILNSPAAVEVSVLVVRSFIKLREIVTTHKDLVHRMDAMESRYDGQFKVVFNSIRDLISAKPKEIKSLPETIKPKIGFGREDK